MKNHSKALACDADHRGRTGFAGATVPRRVLVLGASALLVAALAVVAAGCGGGGESKSEGSGSKGPSLPTSIGKGEGKLSLVAWEGYTQPEWVKPFERQTGCKVTSKYAGSSDEMVTLMRQGGAQYDMVSASGDASVRLIKGGDVRPMNPKLIPDFKNFIGALKSPSHNTIDGVHYGISLQWGPNTLLFNTQKVKPAPSSWAVLYDPKYKGQITIPDNPIQIADAALYRSKAKPELGITDPYELTQKQFDAAVALLKKQRPLLKKHWSLASDEIDLFKNGDATLGASWPYQTNTLIADKVPVKDLVPKEGATGWADTWMLSSKSKHPNCAYMWTKWVSTPKVQAQQAIYFGETPANTKACTVMDQLSPGSCKQYHGDAPASYFKSIKFWKTPLADCGNGDTNCVPYNQWQQAWTEIKG
jgi:putative spermidine/putrescine transport system substrate-binding protein